VATVQIREVISGIFFSLFAGMGNACGAIVGNMIGANEDETAKVYAKRSVVVGIGLALVTGLLMIGITPLFLSFFNISEETLAVCTVTVMVYAGYMVFKVINSIMIVGVCRGGGDTVFAMFIDVLAPWLVGLPMAYLGAEVFRFPVYTVMAMINLEEVVKSIFGIARLISNKWLHNLVHDLPQEDAVNA